MPARPILKIAFNNVKEIGQKSFEKVNLNHSMVQEVSETRLRSHPRVEKRRMPQG
jgi:hypothetical protein